MKWRRIFLALIVFVLAAMLAVPEMASADDKLPAGFIALSEDRMTWDQAKAYCQQQGGKLPLVGGNASRAGDDIRAGTPLDGFGVVNAKWPVGLPGYCYWTGTENGSDNPGYSWIACYDGSGVDISNSVQSDPISVVCVP